MNYTFNGKEPQVDESAFIAPGVHIIGDVKIGKESSIWFNSVLRADEGPITIGDRCNVQDNCTLHLYEQYPLVLEDEVSIGHNVILHGCTVRKGALIGMGATILDGAEIGEQAFIGANALIPPGKKIPPRTMVMGAPGQVIRELNAKDLEIIRITIETYQQKGQMLKKELK
ncbi:gamma carbonic anhydrase family protein [Fictibacillus terranigra]|uniref:Gamma carbonic anhydrase family protein n=1 Tax=Fictibacillus terranigra TaxID=3058424 RepID=A0ABT8ECP8_9BACL|nr:gamma carbonic anhydrase family protein [Fictibacillus sp. CENA-BCM004]MDN4075699.1 gamma carbonic anhydrase family protein [Fictibacillus sp. CENA-BCM004]